MREPTADDKARPDEVTADELLTTVIPIKRKGYAPDAIDTLLERAAATIERLAALDDPVLERERRERADLLQRTLMAAQARADETLEEAHAAAGLIRGDAEAHAQVLVADAEQLAANLVETERLHAHAILEDALARRAVVQSDVAALEEFASHARARLRDTLEAELMGLDRLSDAVASQPVLHEIDLTDATLAGESRAGSIDRDWDPPPPTMSPLAPDRLVPGTDRPVIALMVREPETRS